MHALSAHGPSFDGQLTLSLNDATQNDAILDALCWLSVLSLHLCLLRQRTAQAPNMEQVLAGGAAICAIRAVELVPVHNRYVLFPALDLRGTLIF